MTAVAPEAPIGVFDSGVGGLTLARRVLSLLPHERIVYVADQAHVPYGGRPLDEVRGFAGAISEALFGCGCKAVVMACNISSAVALAGVSERHEAGAVLGMIGPGACRAARATRNGRIGVLATAGTVQSGAYSRALAAMDARLSVVEVPCPDFVPLVESGGENTDAARDAARRYLAPLRRLGADTIILGCTHYPFLLPALQSIWHEPCYVDPAEQAARELAEHLNSAGLLAPGQGAPAPAHLLATTGDPAAFLAHLQRFLPEAVATSQVVQARWHDGSLVI